MLHSFLKKAGLFALATSLGATGAAFAQSARPTAADGFDKVEADGSAVISQVKSYTARLSDKTYSGTLMRWAQDTGWHLSWELGSEFAFDFEASFGNDFFKAIDGVCANLNSTGVPARAVVYEGNKVIRIVAEGAKQ